MSFLEDRPSNLPAKDLIFEAFFLKLLVAELGVALLMDGVDLLTEVSMGFNDASTGSSSLEEATESGGGEDDDATKRLL